MKKKFILAFLALSASIAYAQTPPAEVLELSKREDSIIKTGDLTSEQRSYLWDKTAHDRAGFLVVEVDKAYLDTIKSLVADPAVSKEALPALENLNLAMDHLGFSFLGNLAEDSYRYDVFYRSSNSDLIMLTRWEYRNAGAAISTAEEFFNQKINGADAVLSLAIAKNQKSAIWKLTWSLNGVLYEIYQDDKIDIYGKPRKVPEDIMKVAREVVTNITSS